MCTEAGLRTGQLGCADEEDERSTPARLSRRAAIAGGMAALATATLGAGAAQAGDVSTRVGRFRRLLDLTYPLTTTIPGFVPGEEAVRRTTVSIEEDGYYIQEWRIIEHIGTHVDAPGHFVAGARLAPELLIEELVTPVAVIDISERAAQDPDTVVTVDDVVAYERRNGRIPRDAAVLMNSGWGARIGDAAAYRNADANGTYHFPGFGAEAVAWLLERRRIRSVGVDTLSTDPGNSTTFDVHYLLGGADRYGMENIANVAELPRRGATLVVGLIPFEEGSGGQARIFATY